MVTREGDSDSGDDDCGGSKDEENDSDDRVAVR